MDHFTSTAQDKIEDSEPLVVDCLLLEMTRLISVVFNQYLFDMQLFFALPHFQQTVVLIFLEKSLKQAKFKSIKSSIDMPPQQRQKSIELCEEDFSSTDKGSEELQKVVISQAFLKLYRGFVEKKGINKRLNPLKYVEHSRIAENIFESYFERPAEQNEHLKLFSVTKCDSIRDWLRYASGNRSSRPEFLIDILAILNEDQFLISYMKLMHQKMKRSVSEQLKQIGQVFHEDKHSKWQASYQIPFHKKQLQSAVEITIESIHEYAEERYIEIERDCK